MSKEEKESCQHCGKPGGRRMVDPYQLEVYGTREVMRLHEHCAQTRREDI